MNGYDEWLVGNAGRDPQNDDTAEDLEILPIDAETLALADEWIEGEARALNLSYDDTLAQRYDAWLAWLKAEIARKSAKPVACPF